MNRIRLAIRVLTALGLAGVAVFLAWRDLEELLSPAVYKLTYQFFLLVVAGGAVSWLYREQSRLREEAVRERQEFLELHRDLVAAYNSYKRTKRLLRAKAWRTGSDKTGQQVDLLRVDAYSALVEGLNETQLQFESMVRRINGRNEMFRRVDRLYGEGQTRGLARDVSTVEKYLNKVVQEYESALRQFEEDPDYLQLETLEVVSEFIAPGSDSSDTRERAIESFHRSISNLATIAAESR